MIISVKTSQGAYDIVLERGALKKAGEYLSLNRKVLVVTDSGVPSEYSRTVAAACKEAVVFCFEQGEKSKNIKTYTEILETLASNSFTRTDCVVAVGGGVVGDLSGFAAATYMRGIDFYNIPTTVLSQVDSSVGGKTAIDFMGFKNIVGAFYPPKKVLIDPDTLKTLPQRQISNGLAESIKMAATSSQELFAFMEQNDPFDNIDKVIEKSLLIKKAVVEEDEREAGLRRVLNFGHTLAHAIESTNGLEKYLHGECVALGMLPMCSENARARIKNVLLKLGLPTEIEGDMQQIKKVCRLDKKAAGDNITVVFVDEIGSFEFKKMSFADYENLIG